MKRRQFIQDNAKLGLGLPLIRTSSISKVSKRRVALIGCGWWGNNILREAMSTGNTVIVGLCDPDQLALQETLDHVGKSTGDRPKTFVDFREMLDVVQAEIVIVASPDHWHALGAIESIKHGAHIYLEKPICHTLDEGRAIWRAARDAKRVVQVGTHRRVSPHCISAMDFLRSGKAGEISLVKAFVNYYAGKGKLRQPEDPPSTLNWDMWVGPAQMTDYHQGIHPKGFRNYLNFANGQIGDWGIHWFDQVLWWTEERAPSHVFSTGGKYHRQDDSDAPDTQLAVYEFESFTLQWEHKTGSPQTNDPHGVGCYFYGSEGTMHLGWRDGWTFYPRNKNKEIIHISPSLNQPDDQNIKELWSDFIRSIESDQRPASDIEHGFHATNISLMGMVSYHLGRSLDWDRNKHEFTDQEARSLMSRNYRGDWEYPS